MSCGMQCNRYYAERYKDHSLTEIAIRHAEFKDTKRNNGETENLKGPARGRKGISSQEHTVTFLDTQVQDYIEDTSLYA